MDGPEIVLDVGCVNPECEHFGIKGLGNVMVRRRYGTSGIRFLRCRHRQHEFSERNGTPLYDLRVPKEKIVAVVSHLAEGTYVRKTARLTGVSRDTVGRILKRVGRHAREIHDRLVRDLEIPEVQMDEMWSFVGKNFHKLQICSRDDPLDQAITRLRTLIHQNVGDIDPYLLVFICRSPAELQKAARNYSRHLLAAVTPLPPTPSVQRQRVHIGYLSADFHQHATSVLAAELFESHDRNRFHISAYSVGPEDHSPMRDRLYHAFDHFCDGSNLTDEALAQKIRQDGIDILVDLKGYTRDARPRVLAMRPAPLQINHLGFPGTMGARFMDYIVADGIVLPPEHEPFFDEHPIRLPHGYQVNDAQRAIAPDPLTRRQAGLPERGMVFCCFNQSAMITPELLALWLRLLKHIPESILWLLAFHPFAMKRLHAMAASVGIEPQRLIFAPRLPLAQHLARYRLADLFLDTLPCGAHTTASDALWGGCPVLTCMGPTFPGRVAASLLIHLGLPQLVTTTLAEYERMAMTLALDHQQRQHLRHHLHQRITSSPIFNGRIFARHLEQGFLEAWKRHLQHRPPAPIHIQASMMM